MVLGLSKFDHNHLSRESISVTRFDMYPSEAARMRLCLSFHRRISSDHRHIYVTGAWATLPRYDPQQWLKQRHLGCQSESQKQSGPPSADAEQRHSGWLKKILFRMERKWFVLFPSSFIARMMLHDGVQWEWNLLVNLDNHWIENDGGHA